MSFMSIPLSVDETGEFVASPLAIPAIGPQAGQPAVDHAHHVMGPVRLAVAHGEQVIVVEELVAHLGARWHPEPPDRRSHIVIAAKPLTRPHELTPRKYSTFW